MSQRIKQVTIRPKNQKKVKREIRITRLKRVKKLKNDKG
uniref:Uncharacterized protein n=1 Tax=Siphoviridae sp. ctsxw88 TaxID=2825701 RepID=A0A8S5PGG1_9CAUD|nr:MAG TPA: hypothetical protein [Siphoviridae sp. ctsxw88]